MTELAQFDVSQKTKSTRQDIFVSLKDMLSLGIGEFAKSLTTLFVSGNGTKHQVNKELARWEKSLQRERKVI